ncbi:ArnT family glycosyltransferase [Oricola indica]|jgi:4-amino-4-deoxy-L-arabinose transferase-like glycosyltransferase|uniref:ArnT family glycosyltransferase n=1 Tax=Oricola indica TaxID=2872591 RepID=UPI001CBFDEA5|nr:glycosyltransferase family 39 protein [Oricola indica]
MGEARTRQWLEAGRFSGAGVAARQPGLDAVLPTTRWLVVLLLPLLALKGVQVFAAAPTADEAYYWLWGQHLDWSYYDHPPLAAWLQGLSASLFGWNLFALRATTLLSFAGSLWILWFWSRRLAGREDAPRAFLAGLVVWLSMPILMRFQSLAHQDHLLIFFGLVAAHFWALFIEGLGDGKRIWRFYYAGCVALGLAGLTKYNAVFIGLGFAVWVVVSAKGRPLLASPHLWAGAALSMAMQAPVIAWNVAHDWPSFHYNLESRIGQSVHGGFAGNLRDFVISSSMMLSPVIVLALVRFGTGSGAIRTPFEAVGRWVLVVSTAVFVLLCASNTILSYWNLTAYLFALPVMVFFLRSRAEFSIHALFGIGMSAWIVLGQVVYPSYKLNGGDLRDNDISFGLEEIAAIVAEEERFIGVDMVMTTDYRTASLLSFAGKRTDVLKIGLRNDQFDFWWNPADYKGRDALVLVDDYLPEDELVTAVFERVTTVREFTIERFGLPIHSYRLVLAENYSGEGPH